MESLGACVTPEPRTPRRRHSISTTSTPSTPVRSPNYLHYAVESSLKRRRKRLRSELKQLDEMIATLDDTSWSYNDTLLDSPTSDTSEITFWSDVVFDKNEDDYVSHAAWTSPSRSLLIWEGGWGSNTFSWTLASAFKGIHDKKLNTLLDLCQGYSSMARPLKHRLWDTSQGHRLPPQITTFSQLQNWYHTKTLAYVTTAFNYSF